jgi:hypothetical protein
MKTTYNIFTAENNKCWTEYNILDNPEPVDFYNEVKSTFELLNLNLVRYITVRFSNDEGEFTYATVVYHHGESVNFYFQGIDCDYDCYFSDPTFKAKKVVFNEPYVTFDEVLASIKDMKSETTKIYITDHNFDVVFIGESDSETVFIDKPEYIYDFMVQNPLERQYEYEITQDEIREEFADELEEYYESLKPFKISLNDQKAKMIMEESF